MTSAFDQFDGSPVNINITLPTRNEVYEAARWVLFILDGDHERGTQPGGFTTQIIEAATHADEINLAKLSLGFPAVVTAVSMYKNVPDGVETLRRLASHTPDTHPGDGFSPKGN